MWGWERGSGLREPQGAHGWAVRPVTLDEIRTLAILNSGCGPGHATSESKMGILIRSTFFPKMK